MKILAILFLRLVSQLSIKSCTLPSTIKNKNNMNKGKETFYVL